MFREISKRELKCLAGQFVHSKKIVGLDIGRKRIGVAASDGHHQISIPWGVLLIDSDVKVKDAKMLNSFKALLNSAVALVVGEALGLDGAKSAQSILNHRILASLIFSNSLPCLPVCFWDERYSSIVAEDLAPSGLTFLRLIDAYAASVTLQEFLDFKDSASNSNEY